MTQAASPLLILAGENSGERYGAALVDAFRKIQPDAEFFGVGGADMRRGGVRLLHTVDELSAMGVFEVFAQLPRIKGIFNHIKREVRLSRPRAAVLIDSPDFNLRLARFLKKQNIPVLYYISPTVWAWRKSRLRSIRRSVSKMLLIFPFEEALYRQHGIPAVFVGHPLLERIGPLPSRDEVLLKHGLDPGLPLIALLPGSRQIELRHHLPILAKAQEQIAARCRAQFVLLKAEGLPESSVTQLIPPERQNVIPIKDVDYYPLLAASDLALSACGTANLEAALLATPLVAFYRLSPWTYSLGKPFMKISRYSIVNILAGSEVIPELIQRDFTPEKLTGHALELLESQSKRRAMLEAFQAIRQSLGNRQASSRAAQELHTLLEEHQPKDSGSKAQT
jgi:lipid-A-disaccharide synthase